MQKIELKKIEGHLKKHPKLKDLISFLEKFFLNHDAEFIVLFGSSSKGTFNYRSDLDLLIITNSIKGDFFERLLQMQQITPGGIDFFVYNLTEFKQMVANFNLIALEALSSGLLIYDKNSGKEFQAIIKNLIENNKIQKLKQGWKINQ